MTMVENVAAGLYTVKLKFRVYAGALSHLYLGYSYPYSSYKDLPIGLEYFGYDTDTDPIPPPPVYITLSPTDDSWIFSYYKSKNYGTNPSGEIGYNSGSRTSFINFNLSQLQSMVQSGYIVTNASLILHGWLSMAPTTDIQIKAYHVTQNWSEATITYNNQPSYNSTIIGSVIIPGQPRYDITATIDLTQPLSAVLASQSPFYGYRLYGSNSTQIFIWSTKEETDPANRPQLVVILSY